MVHLLALSAVLFAVVFPQVGLVTDFSEILHVFYFRLAVGVELGVDEWVIAAILRPRTARDVGEVDKPPMHFGGGFHAEVVADGWGDIDASTAVLCIFGAFAAEDVLPVVGGEWAAVFPLGVADAPAVDDLDPATFAAGFPRALIGALVPPWNDAMGDGVGGAVVEAVVKGEGDVERVEPWGEGFGAVVVAGFGVRVVVAAIVFLPFGVP